MLLWSDYYNIVFPLTLTPPHPRTLESIPKIFLKIYVLEKTKSIEETTLYFLQLFVLQLYPMVLQIVVPP
jgi:hypothetical protein